MQNLNPGRLTDSRRVVKTKATILSIVMLATLLLVPAHNANAQQAECLGRCEQQLAICVAEGGEQFGPDCIDGYNSCVNACLDTLAALLEDRQLTANHKPLAEIGGPADK